MGADWSSESEGGSVRAPPQVRQPQFKLTPPLFARRFPRLYTAAPDRAGEDLKFMLEELFTNEQGLKLQLFATPEPEFKCFAEVYDVPHEHGLGGSGRFSYKNSSNNYDGNGWSLESEMSSLNGGLVSLALQNRRWSFYLEGSRGRTTQALLQSSRNANAHTSSPQTKLGTSTEFQNCNVGGELTLQLGANNDSQQLLDPSRVAAARAWLVWRLQQKLSLGLSLARPALSSSNVVSAFVGYKTFPKTTETTPGSGLGSEVMLSCSFDPHTNDMGIKSSYFQRMATTRRILNPLEAANVTHITNYIEFGFEIDSKRERTDLRMGFSWQLNKNNLLKLKLDKETAHALYAFKVFVIFLLSSFFFSFTSFLYL
ncbi:hypothetical protein QOT17_003039 [Balamuthia mandrillaris]